MAVRSRVLVAVLAAAGIVLAACSGGPAGQSGSGPSDSATFALPPNATPNWILPIGIPGHLSGINTAVNRLMWPPLYTYAGDDGSLAFDEKASVANKPVFSDGGKTVTITLKDYTWSTGAKVTARDVEFHFNLIKANKTKWGNYSKGRLPDNVVSFMIVDDKTFTLTLDKVYNTDWFAENQLTQTLRPLPQAAWDKTSADGPVGDFDRDPATAVQVFDFLVERSKQIAEYDKDPLWQVVSGPFRVTEYSPQGQVTLTRNDKYTGPDKATLTTVSLKPFTSADAEYNVLRTGQLDYGYIASSNLGQTSALEQQGYTVEPWQGWAITYIPYNFNNPKVGPIFAQLYVRQAIQHAIDQPSIAKNIWRGSAAPGYGPVPQDEKSPFISDAQKANPYPFDIAKAKALITGHGWTIGADGVATCTSPGAAENQCGAGIAAGTPLRFELLAESGSKETDNTMSELKSSLSQIGVAIDLKQAPLNTVLGNSKPCTPEQAECSWQLSFFGTQGSWYFPAYPSGDRIFTTGATSNLGSYSDPKADELITRSTQSDDSAAMREYGEYLTRNLPVIWLPNPAYQISATKTSLQGVEQDPLVGMSPQRWSRK
ncbi:peptide ABC transporter substrate-binding protein [Pseudonocardia sp. TRM90224]|uniref:peptide ABC transporter substrate-binding protein n=1 Tax=Pseudonocardia sp. TRM90224 TaxID=2812678 RepID=UPI001E45B034|nr:peptide ABC transporter substrate-binding protein [Pseudonocardia sp. TRM90224]